MSLAPEKQIVLSAAIITTGVFFSIITDEMYRLEHEDVGIHELHGFDTLNPLEWGMREWHSLSDLITFLSAIGLVHGLMRLRKQQG